MRFEWQKELDRFLEDVDEQISYGPVHTAVNEELKGHVEDKAEAYMDYGLEEDEAYKRAIRDMGDASTIGVQMNEAHHLRVAKPLLFPALGLIVFGAVDNLMQYGADSASLTENVCALWGILVLILTMWHGYPVLLRHAKKMMALFLALGGIYVVLHFRIPGLANLWEDIYSGYSSHVFDLARIFSPSLLFGIFQLAVPVMAVILYHGRHRWYRTLLFAGIFQTFLMWLSLYPVFGTVYIYTSVAALLISCLGITLYMAGKGYIDVERKKGFASAWALFLVVLALWAVPQKNILSNNLSMFFHPEEQADNAWTDNYNNVLVRELLGRSKWIGKPEFSKEELIGYVTARWYYENGPGEWSSELQTLEEYAAYRMQFQEEDRPAFVDVVPQHYGRNYRIFRWVMEFGRIPAIILVLLILSLYVVLFATTFRIRNRLGRLTALGGGLALTVQCLFYILGNLGFQFGMFGNLPLVSEGIVSMNGTAILVGLVLSAYRFDTVVEGKE